MGPDPLVDLDHQDPLLDPGVRYKYPQAPQGPLWDLESHGDHVGQDHKSQMHSLCNVK